MSENKLRCFKSGPILGCLFAQVATILLNKISFRSPQNSGYNDTLPLVIQNEIQATLELTIRYKHWKDFFGLTSLSLFCLLLKVALV